MDDASLDHDQILAISLGSVRRIVLRVGFHAKGISAQAVVVLQSRHRLQDGICRLVFRELGIGGDLPGLAIDIIAL